MRDKSKILSSALVLLLFCGVLPLTANAAEPLTAEAGDKAEITDAAGHQFFYDSGNYYWASWMDAAICEHKGQAVDVSGGQYKSYYAWCASYGKPAPKDKDKYLLSEGQKDRNGKYFYVDEALHDKSGNQLKIPFDWALSCIKAAERLAIVNGHAADGDRVQLKPAYRMAVEIAIRCISAEVNADELNVTSGYTGGQSELDDVGWSVPDFFAAVKTIYSDAKENPFVYTPPVKAVKITKKSQSPYFDGDYLILGKYTVKPATAAVRLGADTTDGVELTRSGGELTVKIKRSKEALIWDSGIDNIVWNINAEYVNSKTYTMLFGKPIDGSGNVLTTPQNIMIYDAEVLTPGDNMKGSYSPPDEEKASVNVVKTDTEGNVLSGTKFSLYSVGANNTLSLIKELVTDADGKAKKDGLALGTYFLVENPKEGCEPHNPQGWQVNGEPADMAADGDSVSAFAAFKVINFPTVDLPETGNVGIGCVVCLGVCGVAAALVLLLAAKRGKAKSAD